MQKRWDIFCEIVDNFGDIGVCWRLARQLQAEHGLHIRLYVDNFDAASQIILSLNKKQKKQIIQQVEVIFWQEDTVFAQDANVVLETFSCGLPAQYLAQNPNIKWVNLEYLSAEKWVDNFHGKHSVFTGISQKRHFFYPGFTPKTGGLLRENLPQIEADFYHETLQNNLAKDQHSLRISLFYYPQANIASLLNCIQKNSQPTICYVTARALFTGLADCFGVKMVAGEQYKKGQLTLKVLPFLSQSEYDILLRNCDINFVRGEDSWVRAIWAAQPFIWQPYFQTEDTHLVKLNAFLDVFYAESNIGLSKPLSIDGFETKNRPKPLSMDNLRHLHIAWANNQAISAQTWQQCLQDLPHIKAHTLLQAQSLANQPDLATQLVNFCNIN